MNSARPDSKHLTPWLAVERFEYERRENQSAALRLLGTLDMRLGAPSGALLVVARNGESRIAHRPLDSSVLSGRADARQIDLAARKSDSGLLWRASFEVPLEVVDYPEALFTLIADGRGAVALPVPVAIDRIGTRFANTPREGFNRARIRRHVVALAAGLAIAATSGPSVGVAAAGAITGPETDTAATTTVTSGSTVPSTTTEPTTTTSSTATTTTASTTTTGTTTAPGPAERSTGETATSTPSGPLPSQPQQSSTTARTSGGHPAAHKLGRHRHRSAHSKAPGHHRTNSDHDGSAPRARRRRPAVHHPGSAHKHSLPTGGASREPAPTATVGLGAPATSVAGAVMPLGNTLPAAPSISSPWTVELNANPFAGIQLGRLSALLAHGNQPPLFLIAIYKQAGHRYHLPWKVLAAINSIETNYGRNLNVSSAGAMGWMQFMPGTWQMYAVRADGRGRPNPYDPRDAIFTAAKYLAANGARHHLRRAIFAYNHAAWYVEAVLLKAQAIVDRSTSLSKHHGYALPLAPRYMHQLGRTDDGVDIETPPDGALVYSIAPGVASAVASDPGGFGPDYPVIVTTKGPLVGKAIYYGHVALSLVHPGEHVSAGQPIAVMGHTGDAASLGHGHIEIGFSTPAGDPLSHHGADPSTVAGEAMRATLVELSALYGIRNS
jgi:murein DD-endopeptidase MepM/ murein hydrolase activator NlpD